MLHFESSLFLRFFSIVTVDVADPSQLDSDQLDIGMNFHELNAKMTPVKLEYHDDYFEPPFDSEIRYFLHFGPEQAL